MSEQVVVSAAIVDRESRRVLLAQRVGTTSYPWLWCTPGGKVEDGETHKDALSRELYEELGVTLTAVPNFVLYKQSIVSTKTGKTVIVICYVIWSDDIFGKPSPRDGTAGVGWFGIDMVGILPMTPADSAERAAIIDVLG